MDSNKRIPSVVATTKQAIKTTSLMQSMSSKQQQQNLQPLLQQSLNPIRHYSSVSAISNIQKKMDCPLLQGPGQSKQKKLEKQTQLKQSNENPFKKLQNNNNQTNQLMSNQLLHNNRFSQLKSEFQEPSRQRFNSDFSNSTFTSSQFSKNIITINQSKTSSVILDNGNSFSENDLIKEEISEDDDKDGAKQAKTTSFVSFFSAQTVLQTNNKSLNYTTDDSEIHEQENQQSLNLMNFNKNLNRKIYQPRDQNQILQKPPFSSGVLLSKSPIEQSKCMNCESRFRTSTMHLNNKLCANCFKIYQSVGRTVEQNGGTFLIKFLSPGNVTLILNCQQQHQWTIGMKSRKAKNWCNICKGNERLQQQARQLEELERLRAQQNRQQQILLDQALPPTERGYEDQLNELLVIQMVQQNRNPLEQRDLQFQITELFLQIDNETLLRFMQRIEDRVTPGPGARQLIQRLRLCLHPDKNPNHARAGEAFSRLQYVVQRVRYKDKIRIGWSWYIKLSFKKCIEVQLCALLVSILKIVMSFRKLGYQKLMVFNNQEVMCTQ